MFRKLLAVSALIAVGSTAGAATLDAVGDGNNDERIVKTNYLWQSASYTDNVAVQLRGYYAGPTATGYAYFDAGAGGLGVCNTLDTNIPASNTPEFAALDCGADDSIQENESLRMDFLDGPVHVSGLLFGDHGPVSGMLKIMVNNGAYQMMSFADASSTLFENVSSIRFKYHDTEFYLQGATVSAVPLPASALFLTVGFGGLMTLRRRR